MLTNKRKEKISAFLDNDMHRDELMSFSLSAEPEDAETAQRYQVMGDALRGELSDSSFVDVSDAVREALANENIAEQMPAQSTAKAPAETHSSSKAAFDLSAWFRPVAGMAVAASVAVVMVVSLSEQDAVGTAPVATNVEQQPAVRIAAGEQDTDKRPIDIQADQKNPQLDQNLVNQHLEFATQDALQGRLPYVRAVSYETEKK